MKNVLVVDDEPDIRELLEITLSRMNLNSCSAANVRDAKSLLKQEQFDLCLTDMKLPDGNGIELVEHIQIEHPSIPVAVITAFGSMETAIKALKAGTFDFVSKPIDLKMLRGLVDSALKVANIPIHQPTASQQKLLGESTAMQLLREKIDKLSRSQAPVYLCGESGVGKELVAKQIHELGPRSSENFVPVNCGAIPTELMESEFFGHIKGSFTGAVSDKEGLFQAANEILLKADLRRQGINPLKVKKKSKPLFSAGKKIQPKDLAVFSRQLATMMAAGVPLVQSFEIIGRGHEKPSMQDLILAIKGDVESGTSLADSLAKHPKHFDNLFVNLVGSGEQSGALETLLDKIATYKEKTEELKGKVKKALFYPTAILVVAFIVSAILLLFVVPQFQALFEGFGADLPAFTQLVINLSEFMQVWWWMVLLIIGGAIFAFINAKKRSPAVRRSLDILTLKIPVIGNILEKSAIARFARTLSTMFLAGVPLVEALESVAGATSNALFEEATLRMKDDVATGTQLQQSMRATSLFPNMVVQMVAIGEESGSLDDMLSKVADFYEQEVDNLVDGLSSLLEPLIMAILGVVVGGLVIAMYLPIFNLGAVV